MPTSVSFSSLLLTVSGENMYATLYCRACESLSTRTPDGRPYRLTHKYTATLTEVEMSRLRQEVTSEYKRRDGKSFLHLPLADKVIMTWKFYHQQLQNNPHRCWCLN